MGKTVQGPFDGAFNSGTSSLQASGDTSATEFAKWTVFTQSIEGMWTRKFVFNTGPTIGAGGVPSGAPTVAYSYLDTNCTVTTKREFINAAYASGFGQNAAVAYVSDSTVGGFGLSGMFYTSAIGTLRKKWVATDTESYCTTDFNAVVGKYPNAYVNNSNFDTSSSVPGVFFSDIIMPAAKICPEFRVSLVTV